MQPFHQDRNRVALAHIADDTAHGDTP
jgi:hypothetical protein